jgi:ActR/RegA family two-component response regulator
MLAKKTSDIGELIELLMQHGADAQVPNMDGFTSIDLAVYNKNIGALQYFLTQPQSVAFISTKKLMREVRAVIDVKQ